MKYWLPERVRTCGSSKICEPGGGGAGGDGGSSAVAQARASAEIALCAARAQPVQPSGAGDGQVPRSRQATGHESLQSSSGPRSQLVQSAGPGPVHESQHSSHAAQTVAPASSTSSVA